MDVPREPLVAAYDLGALVPPLDFHLQHAVLHEGDSKRHAAKTDALFIALSMLVRQATPVGSRDEAQGSVRGLAADWQAILHSFWYAEAYAQAVDDLDRALGTVDGFAALREELCLNLLCTYTDILRRVRQGILDRLGEDLARQLFALGECVQRGLYPSYVYRYLDQKEKTEPTGIASLSLPDLDRLDRDQVRQSSRPTNHLASRSLSPGQLAPETTWYADISQRLTEIGLLATEYQELLAQVPATDVQLLSVVTEIHHAIRRSVIELQGHRETCTPPKPEYLGLVLDRRMGKVRREGNNIELGGNKRLWALLQSLCLAGERYSSTDELHNRAWVSNKVQVSNDTVVSTINDLKNRLKPLGVTIANMRNTGYRLEEQSAPGV
jgi:hypothetical protein